MHFSLEADHHYFFDTNGWITFEDIVSKEKRKALEKEGLHALQRRFETETAPSSFAAGRDIWRISPLFKKTVLSPALAEIAAILSRQSTLQIAFDHLIYKPQSPLPFPKESSLDTISSFQSVAIGLLLSLNGETKETTEGTLPFPPSPQEALFMGPDLPLPLDKLLNPEGVYLLIVYGTSPLIYKNNLRDPLVNEPRKLGMQFGDRLDRKRFPKVFPFH